MSEYSYTPTGVCPSNINFKIEDGKLHDIKFTGGCPGNLQAISKLLEGADAEETAKLLKGNDCKGRGTSCADQLAQAIQQAQEGVLA